jgi:predicted nucleic acid-binding protein
LRVFVDTSVWYAAVVARDTHNDRAKSLLLRIGAPVITDLVLAETWTLVANRHRRTAAEEFWHRVRQGLAEIQKVTSADLDRAWEIGVDFPDQDFSIVDRTSFAVMERLGISRAASFDHHFTVYRYGPARDRAFDVLG